MDEFENQLLKSYESTLAVEGIEICKELEPILSNNYDLILEKTLNYCNFCLYYKKKIFMDKKLYERCKKFQNDMESYRRIKNTLKDIEYKRKNDLNST